jgi:hypothetical protein
MQAGLNVAKIRRQDACFQNPTHLASGHGRRPFQRVV